jgi:hypothetical protein
MTMFLLLLSLHSSFSPLCGKKRASERKEVERVAEGVQGGAEQLCFISFYMTILYSLQLQICITSLSLPTTPPPRAAFIFT